MRGPRNPERIHDPVYLADDGLKAWEQVTESGYEGLVAKNAATTARVSAGGKSSKAQ
jgi:hypothetical protein